MKLINFFNGKTCSLDGNAITSKGASKLFETLKNSKAKVTHLYLGENKLDDECITSLGEYLQNNSSLVEISLYWNQLSDRGIEILSNYIVGNNVLEAIDFSSNRAITAKSTPYFKEMVSRSCLQTVKLDDLPITFQKMEELRLAMAVPIDQREVPVLSSTKSAAKSSMNKFS